MKIIRSINALSTYTETLKKKQKRVGFIATTGILNENDFSSIKKSKKECDKTIVSIFISVSQSLKSEDINMHINSLDNDKKKLKELKIDILFLPKEETIYPKNYNTYIKIDNLSNILCGITRPTYFESFATTMCKLCNIISPDIIYCSETKYQEYIILKSLVKDLNFNIIIKKTKIVRDKFGVALSHKNTALSNREMIDAPLIYKSLKMAKEYFNEGYKSSKDIINFMKDILDKGVTLKVDYISIVDSETLSELQTATKYSYILIACYCGKSRLIDNISLK